MLDLLLAAALLQTDAECNAFGAPPRTGCPAWRLVRQREAGEVYLDPATLRREGGGFELTIRAVFVADRPDGARTAIVRYRFDCAGRTHAMRHLIRYDARGARLVDRPMTGRFAEPGVPAPDSPSAAILNEFCPR